MISECKNGFCFEFFPFIFSDFSKFQGGEKHKPCFLSPLRALIDVDLVC